MGINGLNLFNRLINTEGQKVEFYQLDRNGDMQITETEFLRTQNSGLLSGAINEQFAFLDTDGDNVISTDEWKALEVKADIQTNVLDDIAAQISSDVALAANPEAQNAIVAELKDFINQFIKENGANWTEKADDLKAQIRSKFETLKSAKQTESNNNLVNTSLNNIYSQIQSIVAGRVAELGVEIDTDSATKRVMNLLEDLAFAYLKNGNDRAGLEAYLIKMATSSEADKLKDVLDANKTLIEQLDALGNSEYVTQNQLSLLKSGLNELLEAALNNKIYVTLGGTKITSQAQIQTLLSRYSDPNKIKQLVNELQNQLSDETVIDSAIYAAKEEHDDEVMQKFESLKGSDFSINITQFNMQSLYGADYGQNATRTSKMSGWRTDSTEKCYNAAVNNALNDLNKLRDQIRKQTSKMLKEKGLTDEQYKKAINLVDNVFTASAEEAAKAVIDGKHGSFWRNSKYEYKLQDLVNTFIGLYNNNIGTAIEEMNASREDFDINALDNSRAALGLGTIEGGRDNTYFDSTLVNYNVDELLRTGKSVKCSRAKGMESEVIKNWIEQAAKMVDNMKSQYKKQAEAVCKANGVEFDNDAFENIFANASTASIYGCISGDKAAAAKWLQGSIVGIGAGVGVGAGVVGAAAISAASATLALGNALGGAAAAVAPALASLNAGLAATAAASSTIPVVGWVVAGVAAVAAAVTGLITVYTRDTFTFDPRDILNTMAENFKGSYESWVQMQKGGEVDAGAEAGTGSDAGAEDDPNKDKEV